MNLSLRMSLAWACFLLLSTGCTPTEPGNVKTEPRAESQASGTSTETESTPGTANNNIPSAHDSESAPDPSDDRIEAAEAALTTGDFSGLNSIAKAILKDHPEHGYARLLLGLSLHKQLLYERAIPEFEAAIRGGASFEKYDATWHFLGWALYNTGRLKLARAAFEKHLLAVPTEGDSHFALGLIDADEGNDVAALIRFQRSIDLNTSAVESGNQGRVADVAKAHARIADIHLARDQIVEAVLQLERCVTIWPAHYSAWFKLHRAHTQLGNDELAASSMKQHDHWKAQANAEPKPGATKQ
ncbi:MAG: tetratricopeptide (TPR) repeat protein [Planctomycetota bacterium]|jgi:tetratricopeptide (TPR) repeat protein